MKNHFIKKLKKYINSLSDVLQGGIKFIGKQYKKALLDLDEDTDLDIEDLYLKFPNFSKYELLELAKNRSQEHISKQIIEILD